MKRYRNLLEKKAIYPTLQASSVLLFRLWQRFIIFKLIISKQPVTIATQEILSYV